MMGKEMSRNEETIDFSDGYGIKDGDGFTVQQVVELSGLGEHTLRYYEKVGLIQPVRRHASSKHRRYSTEDVAKTRTLACLRAAGMPLDQMRRYFELMPGGAAAASELQNLLKEQRIVLHEKMRQMQNNMDYLEYKIAFWEAIGNGDEERAEEISEAFQASLVCRSEVLPPAEHKPDELAKPKEM